MRIWLFLAALNGFLASGAGAIGSHLLKGKITADNLEIFNMAARYHMWHALALFAVAWLASRTPAVPLVVTIAGAAFFLGIICFCGSLYFMSITGSTAMVFVTPVGGVLFLVGWAAMIFSSITGPVGNRLS
jgi:uncharacterized membrane protein YgdD (TMEM256/DUF423 family)